DYFKPTTEIYQGLSLIDKKLGGTAPLDIIISAPQSATQTNDEFEEDFDDDEIDDDGDVTLIDDNEE
ncbi:MAG: hypothetical protein QF505_05355, partial [Candidatus Micropelagos thuwalensis]|nr:hypothetical protein [Candidatus Micropelagos thuwalensis]